MHGTYTLIRTGNDGVVNFKSSLEEFKDAPASSEALIFGLDTDDPSVLLNPIFMAGVSVDLIHNISLLVKAEKNVEEEVNV